MSNLAQMKIMEFRGDTSGLDELLESVDDKYYNTLSQIGRDATRNAKINKTYENRTGNLNNANGGCVVRNGKIVDMWVESDGSHSEAVRNTENLLIYSENQRMGFIWLTVSLMQAMSKVKDLKLL